MRKYLLWAIGTMFVSAGCATTQSASTMSQLQIKVNQLENRLEEKDKELADLKYKVENLSAQMEGEDNFGYQDPVEEMDLKGRVSSRLSISDSSVPADTNIIRVDVTSREVQRALKNAGYYSGAIDGKVGSGSQKAIRDFQKDHNLKVDGIVGRGTWMELKTYLD